MQYANLGFALDRAVASYPHRPFLVDGEDVLTYAEVGAHVDSVTAWLLERGIRKGVAVAAVVTNRPEYIETLLACARIGAVVVPVNYRHSRAEVRSILEHCRPAVVLLEDVFLAEHEATVSAIDAICVVLGRVGSSALPYATLLDTDPASAPAEPWRDLGPEEIQAIHYTSGTTGKPKGVQRSHAANVAMAVGSLAALPVRPEDAWLYALPPHSAGFYGLAMPALLVGARLVLCARFDPVQFAAAAREHQVTHTMLAPTMWHMLATSPSVSAADFTSLRHAVWGGMPMSGHTLDLLDDLLPVPCTGGYGMTESTCFVWSNAQIYQSGRRQASGYPIPGIQIRVRDGDGDGAALPPGESGRIFVRGSVVMAGYLDDPDLTAQVLADDGWLDTGDVGWLDEDGALTVADRAKNMIITGAENVFPTEVEAVLARMNGVQEVAVVGVPHPTWGQQVAAALVADREVDVALVTAHCRRVGLSDYKRPRVVLLLDELPKNSTGKVETVKLVELLSRVAEQGVL